MGADVSSPPEEGTDTGATVVGIVVGVGAGDTGAVVARTTVGSGVDGTNTGDSVGSGVGSGVMGEDVSGANVVGRGVGAGDTGAAVVVVAGATVVVAGFVVRGESVIKADGPGAT